MGLSTLLAELDILGYNELSAAVLTAFLADIPVLLIGPAGTAKTTIAQRLAIALKKRVFKLDVPHITLEQLLGIPNPFAMEKDKALEFVGGLASLDPELIILDELTRGNPLIQSYILELVRARSIRNVQLKCAVIAAANPPAANLQSVNYLDLAFATRFAIFDLPKPTVELLYQIADSGQLEKEDYSLSINLNTYFGLPTEFSYSIRQLAKQIIGQLRKYELNGRQVINLLILLAKAEQLDKLNLHVYTRIDIAQLAASLIPCRLVRMAELQNTSFYDIVANVARVLPEYIFRTTMNSTIPQPELSLAGELADIIAQITTKTLPELITIVEQHQPASNVAFGEILNRLLTRCPEKLKEITVESQWQHPILALAKTLS